VRDSLDAACTLLGSLFIASIGLLVSPRFLLRHLPVLALGTLGIAALKCTLVASVVRAFGPPWRTALTVGVILAHTGMHKACIVP
jgi:predicted Kef-type K+ transport protein